MGGVLNEDTGGEVPVDVTERIRALGITCVEDIRTLPAAIHRLALVLRG